MKYAFKNKVFRMLVIDLSILAFITNVSFILFAEVAQSLHGMQCN